MCLLSVETDPLKLRLLLPTDKLFFAPAPHHVKVCSNERTLPGLVDNHFPLRGGELRDDLPPWFSPYQNPVEQYLEEPGREIYIPKQWTIFR